MSGCANCGRPTPVDLRTKPPRPQKWCSEACRRRGCRTLKCVDCGAPRLADRQSDERRCPPCAHKAVRARTRQWVIDSYRDWQHRYGESPRSSDWNLALVRSKHLSRLPVLEERHAERRWPSTTTVANHFNTWNGLVAYMGDPVYKSGQRRRSAVAA